MEAPGYVLFDEIIRRLPDIRIVAEDLGELRPEVLELRDHYHLMGMNIAEFSLLSPEPAKEHELIYTGTHDNQTVQGWYAALDGKTKGKVLIKLARYGMPWESVASKLVRYVYGSRASMAIVPLADIIGVDDDARLNTPGTVGSPNWEWRIPDWTDVLRRRKRLKKLVLRTARTPKKLREGWMYGELKDNSRSGGCKHGNSVKRD